MNLHIRPNSLSKTELDPYLFVRSGRPISNNTAGIEFVSQVMARILLEFAH